MSTVLLVGAWLLIGFGLLMFGFLFCWGVLLLAQSVAIGRWDDDPVVDEEWADALESADYKMAELIPLLTEEANTLQQVVGRLDGLETAFNTLQETDVELLGHIEAVKERVIDLEEDDFDWGDDAWDDEDDSELDDDFEDDWDEDEDEWEDDEDDEYLDLTVADPVPVSGDWVLDDQQPVLTDPAVQVAIDGPLPTAFPISVSQSAWDGYLRWLQGQGGDSSSDNLIPNQNVPTDRE